MRAPFFRGCRRISRRFLPNCTGQVEENAHRARELEEATRKVRDREAQLQSEAVRREQKRQREWEKKSESVIAGFEARAQVLMQQLAEHTEQRKAGEQAQRLISKTKREFREEAAEAIKPPADPVKGRCRAARPGRRRARPSEGCSRGRNRPPHLEKRNARSRSGLP